MHILTIIITFYIAYAIGFTTRGNALSNQDDDIYTWSELSTKDKLLHVLIVPLLSIATALLDVIFWVSCLFNRKNYKQ